jgi:hypothetical protein
MGMEEDEAAAGGPAVRLGWWGRLVEAVGWGNGKGHLSFNKQVTWTALAVFVYCVVTRREPSWALLSFGVVVIGAGFGLKGYLGAIKQNTTAAHLQARTNMDVQLRGDVADVVRAVRERRDPAAGVEAAP